MAAKLVIFAALYLFSNIESAPVETAENDIRCSCEDVPIEETELLMQFLKEEEEKQGEYPIYPGILSPQVKCSNCIEYSRKKRKTQPESDEATSTTKEPVQIPVEVASEELDFESEEDEELPTDYGFPDGVHDKRCPIDTLRQGRFCVPIPNFLLRN